MGFYREHVLPRLVDRACGTAELRRWRDQVTAGLSGTVVEVGFGSGLNLPSLPPEVDLLYAVEPAGTARKLAERRVAEAHVPVEHVGLRGEQIPLPDDSCDAALSTFTLCTIPDVDGALAELRRVLRPGGRLHVLEHGRSPEPGVAAWQRRLEPVQKVVADGCHLTRDPVALLERAGYRIDRLDQRDAGGPKPWTFFTLAEAIAPG